MEAVVAPLSDAEVQVDFRRRQQPHGAQRNTPGAV
jgi:hypothetical protein